MTTSEIERREDLLVAYLGVAARASAQEQQASLSRHVSSSAPTSAR
jgi:hypothetical protein